MKDSLSQNGDQKQSSWASALLICSTGFAMFSMFFGSGNLVFPLLVGTLTEGHFLTSSLGLMLTGVLVPFLSLMAILMKKGSYDDFFAALGPFSAVAIPFFLISLMGPLAVVPRCITVAYGSFLLIDPETPVLLFNLVMTGTLFVLLLNPEKLVGRVGFILTPVLLISLALLIAFGIVNGEASMNTAQISERGAFFVGLEQGYQTMDLIAAFFFSTIIVNHIKARVGEKASLQKIKSLTLKSLLLGAGILAAVYVAFVFLGAAYAPFLSTAHAEQSLAIIAEQTLGVYAAPLVCVAVIMACLTTAVVLTAAFTDFVYKDIVKEKISWRLIMTGALVISFFISTLSFQGIASYLGPILEVLYPGLILLTLLSLLETYYKFPYTKISVFSVFIMTAFFQFY